MPRPTARLVVVLGPIAAGKSVVAREVAARVQATGRTVAVVDVDEVASMVPGRPEDWDLAHQVHGRLVGAWLETPVELVVAHGPIYTRRETSHLMSRVPDGTGTLRVLLRATYPAALRRVAGDPERGLSKDPGFLQRAYERFEQLRPGIAPCDLELDTEQLMPGEIADRVIDRLLAPA
ncbi:hypothetical protein [Georgenia alba]|uniref:Shikimate kinase n=1 Tax=Georgenia alba TaxID=2233858 RepID=A0ABW2Q1V3_9MICO